MDIKFVLFYLSNRCEEMKVNVSLGALNFGRRAAGNLK